MAKLPVNDHTHPVLGLIS